jgi:predicted dehydrogenase
MSRIILVLLVLAGSFGSLPAGRNPAESLAQASTPIRIGIIGLDTSHSVAFTRILNDPESSIHVPGARVVAAFPGGSPDIPSSIGRLSEYRQVLEDEWNVVILDSIEELTEQVDAILLNSVDGRTHLEQVRPVFAAGRLVYIDKPLAASLEDAREIIRLSKEHSVPFFSASSLRFFPGIAELKGHPEIGEVIAADAFSPASVEPHHPDLYWYGIHGVETLFTVMGTGWEKVLRVTNPDGELVVGLWSEGRIGTFRGLRKGPHQYGVRVFSSEGVFNSSPVDNTLYQALLREIVKFFRTGVPPISAEETLEILEFMSAAQLSSDRGGQFVSRKEVHGSE